jgi:hypothetical protein
MALKCFWVPTSGSLIGATVPLPLLHNNQPFLTWSKNFQVPKPPSAGTQLGGKFRALGLFCALILLRSIATRDNNQPFLTWSKNFQVPKPPSAGTQLGGKFRALGLFCAPSAGTQLGGKFKALGLFCALDPPSAGKPWGLNVPSAGIQLGENIQGSRTPWVGQAPHYYPSTVPLLL